MKIHLILYLIITALPTLVSGQGITDEISQEIDRRIELEISPSISIGLLLPSGEVRYHSYGRYKSEANQKADSTTLYEIGSVTKTFTSTLSEIYFGDSLNTSLSEIFTEIDNPGLGRVTLFGLRNHIAGIPRLSDQFSPKDWSDPFNGYSDRILEEELQHVDLDTLNSWSYSNLGYGILGKALERTTGRSFEDLMGTFLVQAGMLHTFFSHQLDSTRRIAEPTNIGTANSYWHFSGPSRYAGGLLSCTKDLISYLKYQQAKNLMFSPDSIDNLIQTGINNLGEGQLFYKNGWFILKPAGHTGILLHNGITGGFTSFVAYNKGTGAGVVMLSSSASLVDDIGLKLIYPDFPLNRPERTIAYELADKITEGKAEGLAEQYETLKSNGHPDNLIDIYWLERFYYGKGNWQISNQLSDIMVKALPDDSEVMDIKGQNLEKLQKYREAIEAYEKALELNPESQRLKDKLSVLKNKPKKNPRK